MLENEHKKQYTLLEALGGKKKVYFEGTFMSMNIPPKKR
jgi:hypothetical protein